MLSGVAVGVRMLGLVLYSLLMPFQTISSGKTALLGRVWTVLKVADPRLPVFVTVLPVERESEGASATHSLLWLDNAIVTPCCP